MALKPKKGKPKWQDADLRRVLAKLIVLLSLVAILLGGLYEAILDEPLVLDLRRSVW
jgi:hypothetical protein